jgi:L-iditol 2-dehydrogenase
MKAVVLSAVNKLAIAEVKKPKPGVKECLVKVLACGICGTDRHIYHGEYPSAKPVILGHEFGGVIEEVGPSSKFKVGQVVSDELNPLHLAFIEPLACSIRGLDLANLKGGEKVAVLGGGVIGLLVVQLAKLAGASEIVLITRQKFRRDVALKIGATRVIDPNSEDVNTVVTNMDVVFECAGAVETFKQAQNISRRGGSVIVLGLTASDVTLEVNPFNIVVNELRIQGSFLNPLTQGRAAELVESGKLNLDILISKVVDLAGVQAILDAPPAEGDIKYIACP